MSEDRVEVDESGVQISRLTEWENEPSVLDLKQEYSDARSETDRHINKVKTWLDHLNGTGVAKPQVKKGNSSLVPKLIRKQAEWRYSSLSEPFLNTPDVFNIYPATHKDVYSARQNQLVLNHQFNTKLNKVAFIDEYVRTAVDEGTVIVRLGWNYEEKTVIKEEEQFEYVPDPGAADLHAQLHGLMETDPAAYDSHVPREMKEAHEITMQMQYPHVPRSLGMQEVEETIVVANHPTLEVCDFKSVTIDPSCNGDPDKANFFIFTFESSKAELMKDGRYKNLEKINMDASSILGSEDHESKDNDGFNFNDDIRKKIIVREYWGFKDINGDGELVPIVAAWVNDTIIRMEESPFPDKQLPFVVVPYMPVRKSLYGEPDGELLIDNQKIIGAVTRGMIDLMAKSANSQTGVRKDALDIVNKRKFDRGDDYEFNGNIPDPRHAIFTHTYPEIPASAQFMIGWTNNEAESLTGVKAFNDGISGATYGDTATGVRGAMDAASKREVGILRRLAAGMIKIGRKIIAMNAEFLSEEEVIRITDGEFAVVKRDDLQGDFDLQLAISTAEEDNQKAGELSFMLQTMGNNMDFGISKVILSDIARLRKMPQLAQKIESYEPQPDPLQQQKTMLEIELLKAQIADLGGKTVRHQTGAKLDEAKVASEYAKAEKLGSEADLNTLDFVEQETGTKQERDLEKHGAQAEANARLEMVKAALNNRNNQPAQ